MDTDQVNNYQRQLHLPFADGMGLMLEKSYNIIYIIMPKNSDLKPWIFMKYKSSSGMLQAGGPPQILTDHKALPGSGGAPHYYWADF